MLDQADAARLRATLVSIGGGYLRNPVRQRGVTCADCLTPVDSYRLCFQCKGHRVHNGLGDAMAFLTYAVAGEKSGYVMRGYKARPAIAEHRMVVGLLLLLALGEHTRCADVLTGTPVTHWAIVPSLPSKPGEHPLRSLVINSARGSEVTLLANASASRPRDIDPAHFTSTAQLQQHSHVMLVDDTWTSGGHAQSAVLALRKAGADKVSLLVVARWIKEDFAHNKDFVEQLAGHDYDPGVCPWTGGNCP
jgi:predicted amidophosphoribosyltransferase